MVIVMATGRTRTNMQLVCGILISMTGSVAE
jgi:hypothetical protein